MTTVQRRSGGPFIGGSRPYSKDWRSAALLLLVATSCGKCTPTCGPPLAVDAGQFTVQSVDPTDAGDRLWGIVQDEYGRRNGATLNLFALAPAPCPCGDEDEVDDCVCAASLADHRRRVATCPAVALASTTSIDGGAWQLAAVDGGTLISAETNGLGRWLRLDGARAGLSVQLEPTRALAVEVEGAPDLRAVTATALFETGWCLRLERQDNTFTALNVPNEDAMVLVEAPGLTPVLLYASVGSEDLVAILLPLATVSGTCESESTAPRVVRWKSPYEQRETTTDARGNFRFEGLLAVEANVTCTEGETVVDEWIYDADSGELLGTLSGGASDDDDDPSWHDGGHSANCGLLEVVDPSGNPVENASVEISGRDLSAPTHDFGSFPYESASTNARGRVCRDALLRRSFVTIDAPGPLGGSCAGRTRVTIAPWDPETNTPPITRVVLPITARKRSAWRGRVVDSDGVPVAQATVQLTGVGWKDSNGDECEAALSGDAIVTRGDGTFQTAPIPEGELGVVVQHRWYAHLDTTVTVPSEPRDLVLSRGASWTGRALGPDGPLEGTTLWITDSANRTDSVEVPSDGSFSFRGLAAGEVKLSGRLAVESQLGRREILLRRTLGASEALQADLTLPGGATISGRAVGPDGGVPRFRFVEAIPEDDRRFFNEHSPARVIVPVGPDGRFVFRALTVGAWRVRGFSGAKWLSVNTGTVDLVVPSQ